MPLPDDEWAKGKCGFKGLQYMALEIPVVTTALPDLKDYSDIVGYSNNHDEFIFNCKSILNGNYKEKVRKYKNIAEENSWESKAIQINSELLKIISSGSYIE